jgi:hypothetical protein
MTQSCQIKQRYTFTCIMHLLNNTCVKLIPLTILLLDADETVRNLSIEFSVALLRLVARLFMFLLIFNEQRVPKFTFVFTTFTTIVSN